MTVGRHSGPARRSPCRLDPALGTADSRVGSALMHLELARLAARVEELALASFHYRKSLETLETADADAGGTWSRQVRFVRLESRVVLSKLGRCQ